MKIKLPVVPPGVNGMLTAAEVAEVFQVDPKTVIRWADKGRIAHIRTPGGHRRYMRDDVDAALIEGFQGSERPRR